MLRFFFGRRSDPCGKMQYMCGRYVVTKSTSDMVTFFDVERVGETLAAESWNIAPTDRINIVLDALPKSSAESEEAPAGPIRRLEAARWGLVPPWAKELSVGARMFNARAEEAAEKSAFRTAVKKRRAAIPASGYYEWRKNADGTKTPYFISPPDDQMFAFAGLYEWWKNPAAAEDDPAKWVLSATILTQDSAGELAAIHDRMPVVLTVDTLEPWLDPTEEGDAELVAAIAAEGIFATEAFALREVDRAVGNVRNNSPELIDPVAQ
jgi:putative SOS response-associated peptidase YedK